VPSASVGDTIDHPRSCFYEDVRRAKKDAADVGKPRERNRDEGAGAVEEMPKHPSQWSIWVGAGPAIAWGIAPSAVADARLFVAVRRNDLSLEVAAESSYPSTHKQWGGSGFREVLVGGSAGLCGHHSWLVGCALVKAGQLRAEGSGVDNPKRATGFVAQAGLRVAAAVSLGRSWLVAGHVDGLVSLRSSTVQLNDVGIWDMPLLGALAGADLAIRFW
jgi:hypothetical protein